ncbi:UDP-glycosyltransferase 82A1 [Coffea arabica]|uniref:Glycosyltransferase n=1 Tax=Coffea arabica TaxID=13443 RepID=A0A6P6S6N6_COFAR
MKYFTRAGGKVILVPYPAQGHVTPMLKLACELVSHGLEPVLVVPEFIHRSISAQIDSMEGIVCQSIPADGLDEGKPRDFFAMEMAMEKIMPLHLEKLVRQFDGEQEQDHDEGRVSCMIVDLLASYAINVARRCGVKVAGFWPAMVATYRLISAIPDMLLSGIISETGCPLLETPICVSPGQPSISAAELPWLIGTSAGRTSRFKFWTRTMDRSKTLEWLLVNSFAEECHGGQINVQNIIPIRPTSNTMHSRTSTKTVASFWKEDLSCLDWLDKQAVASVVYISFGSWVSPIGEAKVKNLAVALETSGRHFLWVLGPAWREGLPRGFVERMSKEGGQGKIVSWAPQMEVLQHEGVGCYLTHCGWNSTVEAIQCKKRLLCYPVAGDQFLNCAYIVKAWRIGVRLQGFAQRDLAEGLKRVMEDIEMDGRIVGLNEKLMGKEATSRAATNLASFVNNIVSM